MTSWLGRHPNFSGRKHFEAPACVAHGKEIGIHALSVAAALLPNGTLDLLDVQDEMLENLKRRANKNGVKNIVTTQGDAQALPYSDQMFDAEIMIETLGEISDHAAALSELRRVLKPGGRLVVGEAIIDPDYISLSALEEKVRDAGFVLERTLAQDSPILRGSGQLPWPPKPQWSRTSSVRSCLPLPSKAFFRGRRPSSLRHELARPTLIALLHPLEHFLRWPEGVAAGRYKPTKSTRCTRKLFADGLLRGGDLSHRKVFFAPISHC